MRWDPLATVLETTSWVHPSYPVYTEGFSSVEATVVCSWWLILHVVLKLRMCGALLPFPLYALTWMRCSFAVLHVWRLYGAQVLRVHSSVEKWWYSPPCSLLTCCSPHSKCIFTSTNIQFPIHDSRNEFSLQHKLCICYCSATHVVCCLLYSSHHSRHLTKCRGQVVNTLSYSGCPRLKFRSGGQPSWLRFFTVFLSPPRQMPG
jgi:hypothetical protein